MKAKKFLIATNVALVAVCIVLVYKFEIYKVVVRKIDPSTTWFDLDETAKLDLRKTRLDNLYKSFDHSRVYRDAHADIVMVGDSITFFVSWQELLPSYKIASRALPGIRSDELRPLLERAFALNPRYIFILVGINDFDNHASSESIAANIIDVSKEIKNSGCVPIIQSTLHVTQEQDAKPGLAVNKRVDALNTILSNYCQANDVPFLDLNAVLGGEALAPQFSADGMHLSAEGYQAWARAIEHFPLLNSLNKRR